MRFTKDFWIWLIETQIEELKEHDTPGKLANEFADIIGIALQAIQELSNDNPIYSVHDIIEARIQRNIEKIPEIAYKYRNKWIAYEDKVNKDERNK